MKEAVALVDAALSYLTRMAFQSSLSGDVSEYGQGFLLPRASVSQGTLQQFLE